MAKQTYKNIKIAFDISVSAPTSVETFFTSTIDQLVNNWDVSSSHFATELLYRSDQLSSSILRTITEDSQPKWRKATMNPLALSQSLSLHSYNRRTSCQNSYSWCYKLNTLKPLLGPKWRMHAWFILFFPQVVVIASPLDCLKSSRQSAHQIQKPYMPGG